MRNQNALMEPVFFTPPNGGGVGPRRLYKGGGSSSSNATTTTSTDKRMVVDQGIGISSDSSSVYVNALDGDIVKHALDTVRASDAVAGQGYSKLLDTSNDAFSKVLNLTGKVFDAGVGVIKAGQQMTADAYQTATAEKSGSIDNKTIMILGIAGAAAWAFSKAKK